MSLFSQTIVVEKPSNNYVIEKKVYDLTKSKIDICVRPGTQAVIPVISTDTVFIGRPQPYEFKLQQLAQKKSEQLEIFSFVDNLSTVAKLNFFGGSHLIDLSVMQGVKGHFSLVGTAYFDVVNYGQLAAYFNKSVTIEDIENEIGKNDFKAMLSNEVTSIAKQYIGEGCNDTTFAASINKIIFELTNGVRTRRLFQKIGLRISEKGTSMHVNALDDATEKESVINQKILDAALYGIDKEQREDVVNAEERERQHELDMARAANTKITETKTEINKTINGKDVKTQNNNDLHCSKCGTRLNVIGAKYCPKCGQKIN